MTDYKLIIGLMCYLKELDTRLNDEGLPNEEFIETLSKDHYEFDYLNKKLFNELL